MQEWPNLVYAPSSPHWQAMARPTVFSSARIRARARGCSWHHCHASRGPQRSQSVLFAPPALTAVLFGLLVLGASWEWAALAGFAAGAILLEVKYPELGIVRAFVLIAVLLAVGVLVVFQLLFTYLPVMQTLFGLRRGSARDFTRAGSVACDHRRRQPAGLEARREPLSLRSLSGQSDAQVLRQGARLLEALE